MQPSWRPDWEGDVAHAGFSHGHSRFGVGSGCLPYAKRESQAHRADSGSLRGP